MSDVQLQRQARAWHAHSSSFLLAQRRHGVIGPGGLELLAALGDAAASEALTEDGQGPPPALPRSANKIGLLIERLSAFDRAARVLALVTAARHAWLQTQRPARASVPAILSRVEAAAGVDLGDQAVAEQRVLLRPLATLAQQLDPAGLQRSAGDLPLPARQSAALWACVHAAWAACSRGPASSSRGYRAVRAALRATRGPGMYLGLKHQVVVALQTWVRSGAAGSLRPERTGHIRTYVERRALRSQRRLLDPAPGRGCPHAGAEPRSSLRVVAVFPSGRRFGLGSTLRSCCRDDPDHAGHVRFWLDLQHDLEESGIGDRLLEGDRAHLLALLRDCFGEEPELSARLLFRLQVALHEAQGGQGRRRRPSRPPAPRRLSPWRTTSPDSSKAAQAAEASASCDESGGDEVPF